jgi:hypothetical protein
MDERRLRIGCRADVGVDVELQSPRYIVHLIIIVIDVEIGGKPCALQIHKMQHHDQ